MSDRLTERVFPPLVLPLPPTDNYLRMPVVFRGRASLILTKEYRAWKKQLEVLWLQWTRANSDFQLYKVSADFFLKFEYQIFLASWTKDAQNHEKALRDGLEGLLFVNDRYVYIQAQGRPEIDKKDPRIVLDPNPVLL